MITKLEAVSKQYKVAGQTLTALQPTALEIEQGKLTLIIGPPGSGKTTLLSLLGCVTRSNPIQPSSMRHFFIAFMLLFPTMLHAQQGVMEGTITSAFSDAPIAAVTIIIQGIGKGTVSDSAGHYRIGHLDAGFYNVRFSMVGYAEKNAYDVQVTNSRPTTIDVSLEENRNTLNAVLVAAPRFSKAKESPVSLRTIGSTEIRRNPGGNRDISKVIQSLPGVESSVGFRNDIIVRGGSPSENRFYIDGVETPVINHFATQGASGGPIGIINVDFIKSVDFYSGAFPADRGDALSSVIDFKLKDGARDKEHATCTIGSSDLGVTVEGPIAKQTTFISSYRYSYLQGLFKLLKLPFLPSYQDFQLKIKTKLDPKNEITLLGLGAVDRFNINTDIPHTELNDYTLATIPYNGQENYTVGAEYKHYRIKGYSLMVLSRDYLHNTATKYPDNDNSKPYTLNYDSRQSEDKFRFENVSNENGYRIDVGAGLERIGYFTQTYALLPFGNEIYHSNINLFKYFVFGQLSCAYLAGKLNLSFGVRADANTFFSQRDNPLKTTSPRLSLSYSFTDKLSINFNTGIYFELPSYTLLGYKDSSGRLVNSDVKYISNKQVVLGLEYNTLKNTKFTIEGFYKLYANYPLVRTLGDSISLANLGVNYIVSGNYQVVGATAGDSYGLEFFLQQRLTKGFYGIGAFTVFNSEFKDKNGVSRPSSWDTRYILSITLGKIWKRNWEVGAKFRYTGGGPYTPYNIPASSVKSTYSFYPQGVPDWSESNSLRLRRFYQVDLRVDKKYPLRKCTVNVFIDFQNLTNFQYSMPPILIPDRDGNGNLQDLPGDPSRIKTKLLSNSGGNITPSIGIILEL